MANNFDAVIDHVIINESGHKKYRAKTSDGVWGFVNNPLDRGGATMHGVTKREWQRYTNKKWAMKDFKALRPGDVKKYYRDRHWQSNECDKLPAGIDYFVFDYSVNSGAWSAKHLQRIVGAVEDGRIGDRTIRKVEEYINSFETEKQGCQALLKAHEGLRRKMIAESSIIHTSFKVGLSNRIDNVMSKCYELMNDVYINEHKPLEESRTISDTTNQIKGSMSGAGISIFGFEFESPLEIIRQVSEAKTLLKGFESLLPYAVVGLFLYVAARAVYIRRHRIEDWITRVRL